MPPNPSEASARETTTPANSDLDETVSGAARATDALSGNEKGTLGGNCNRTACQKPGAWWFNRSTRAYYCGECAGLLNYYSRDDAMRLFDGPLCVRESLPDRPTGVTECRTTATP